jgi:hypothetical protein
MPRSIQLSIPDPCQEKWSNMAPNKDGRFCSSCSKNIVDFSSMSNETLVAFFKKGTAGTVCGRFSNEQLQRDFLIPQRRIPWMKYFFQVALPGFLFSAKAISQSKDSASMPRIENLSIDSAKSNTNDADGAANSNDTIRGRITDSLGNPVPSASIQIRGTKSGAIADEAGYFQLYVKQNPTGSLMISSIGYESKLVDFNDTLRNFTQIKLTARSAEECFLYSVGVVVTARKKHKRKPVPLPIPTTMDVPKSTFRLYPNPLTTGSSLNMELQKVDEGYHFIDVTNQAGLSVYQKKVWIDNDAKVINFDIPVLAAGVYFVALRQNNNSKQYSQQLLIQ